MWERFTKAIADGLAALLLSKISDEVEKVTEGKERKKEASKAVAIEALQAKTETDPIATAAKVIEKHERENDRALLAFGRGTGMLYIARSHAEAPPQWRGNPTIILPPGYKAVKVALVGQRGEYELEFNGLANPWHDQGLREHWRSRQSPEKLKMMYGKMLGIRIDGKLVRHTKWGQRGE